MVLEPLSRSQAAVNKPPSVLMQMTHDKLSGHHARRSSTHTEDMKVDRELAGKKVNGEKEVRGQRVVTASKHNYIQV